MRRQAIILLIMTWLMLGVVNSPEIRACADSQKTPPAVVTPGPSAPVLVSKVTFDKRDSGETFVDVVTSRSVSYRVTHLPEPARLVVDIDGAQNTSRLQLYQADTAVLKAVRIAQFRVQDPSVVRVVADLNGNPAYAVHPTTSGFRIELRPREVTKSMPLASVAAASQTKPLAAATAHTPVVPVLPAAAAKIAQHSPAAADASGQKTLLSSTVPMLPVAASTPAALVPATDAIGQKSLPSSVLPAFPLFASKSATLTPATDVMNQTGSVFPDFQPGTTDVAKPAVQNTLPLIASSSNAAAPAPAPAPSGATPDIVRAEHAAQTLNPQNVSESAAAQGAPPTSTAGASHESKPEYTGEPISLNLKDVDLKDFFRLVHEISGLNIIVDPNVSGSVTMVLDSVPWDQALDIVLKDNGLGKVLEGNVLRIAKLQTLTAEQETQTKLAAARMDAAPLATVFQHINYAKAADIATLLKTWAGGGALSRRGTVLVDTRGNTLIISDVESQIPIILNVVSKIDRRSKQVSIEARVVLASADFTRTLSSALSGSVANPSGSTLGGGQTGTNSSITPSNTLPNGKPPLSSLIMPSNPTTGFGAIAITNASSRYVINAVISAQEERDQAKTISRPTIVTQNNVQGRVQQGVEVPIQTTINNTISVQYINATLQLTVTPQVTDDNNVFLVIEVRNDSVGAAISGVGPEINTQQATTSVLVPDGGTVVFGGITVTSRSKSATYVPLLGNIPVLGHLFKTSNTSDQDQELLFFVSPTVLES